jgi:hypothetical protein
MRVAKTKEIAGEAVMVGNMHMLLQVYAVKKIEIEMKYQIEDTIAKIILHIIKHELFVKSNLRPSDTDMLQKSNVCGR